MRNLQHTTSLTAVSETLTSAAEPAAPADDASGSALIATLPYELTGATLSTATDLDYVKIVNATKHLHVIAGGTNPSTDTQFDVVAANGTSMIGGAVDGGTPGGDGDGSCGFLGACGEDYLVPTTIAAGTYYIKVEAGSLYDVSAKDYALLAWFE